LNIADIKIGYSDRAYNKIVIQINLAESAFNDQWT